MTRIILIAFLLLGTAATGQEVVTLTTPITKASATNCRLQSVLIEPIASRITVDVVMDNGDHVLKIYNVDTTPTGAALLSALNTSNNSAGTSLVRRIHNRLLADGVCVGTVTGTPQ